MQTEQNQRNKYHQIFRLKEVYLLAFFILAIVGVGATIGGEHRSQRIKFRSLTENDQDGPSRTLLMFAVEGLLPAISHLGLRQVRYNCSTLPDI